MMLIYLPIHGQFRQERIDVTHNLALFPKCCRRQVLPADDTCGLEANRGVRNHIRQRRSRQFLAEWILLKLGYWADPCNLYSKEPSFHAMAELLGLGN